MTTFKHVFSQIAFTIPFTSVFHLPQFQLPGYQVQELEEKLQSTNEESNKRDMFCSKQHSYDTESPTQVHFENSF